MTDYTDFLAGKVIRPVAAGFDVPAAAKRTKPWKAMFPFQRKIVEWALRLGRSAIFADTGLGKSLMQLAWATQVAKHTGKPVLILTPLAVGAQTVREAEKFGMDARLCRQRPAVGLLVNVTNYQKLLAKDGDGLSNHFDPAAFAGVVLDESSILKSYMGKTKQLLIDAFRDTPYKLACTATPAPNDHLELGNHSQFLGVMDSDEMISRWFINDTSEAGKYRLKGHAADDFWRWVASWAACVGKPSDLGDDDAGFDLPPLNMHQHVVGADATSGATEGLLWRDESLTATSLHREMRLTTAARAKAVADLVNGSSETWLIWCNTNYEADAIKALIPDAVEVRGNDSEARKEEYLRGFSDGRFRVLLSKPSICGQGMNWQHCHNVAFVGLSYSHEQFYQSVRRCWRFGQRSAVDCHIVLAETEGEVLGTLQAKEEQFREMRRQLVNATRATVLGQEERRELVMIEKETARGENWTLHLGDCVEWARSIERASVGLSVFSPPFAGLYIYSDALQDMGNSASDDEFFTHFGYLVPELYRITKPGRLCCVHCKDLPRYQGRDGSAGLKDFPGAVVRLFEQHGWTFHSRVTIWKCPVTEMTRTKNQGLLYKQLRADSCYSRQGMADYVLCFRKWEGGPEAFDPVRHPLPGELLDLDLTEEQAARLEQFPLDQWQQWASPVWMDINQMDTLNGRLAKEGPDEKHICPLQLEVIRRCVRLWSNPGDLVFTPFAGIGSEPFVALLEKRRALGIELKRQYWQHAQRHCQEAEYQSKQKTLEYFMGVEAA